MKLILYICIWIVGIDPPIKVGSRTLLPDTFVRDNLKSGIMKTIKLTKGQVALVDDADYDWLNKIKWQALLKKEHYYVRTSKRVNGRVKSTYMHQLIINPLNGNWVDHIDHNPLNNQRSNLRVCTNSQNQMNQVPHGKSKYKGVSFGDRDCKYIRVCIRINGKITRFYGFRSELEAAKFYDNLAKQYYGEFAHLNFKD
jgi:hypothetical protein